MKDYALNDRNLRVKKEKGCERLEDGFAILGECSREKLFFRKLSN
jgi:hypothetical protein